MKQKLILIVVLAMIIILASLSLISAFSFRDFFVKITGKAVSTATCTDSDSGLNYYIKGTVERCIRSTSCKKYSDSCVGFFGSIQEKYCKGSNAATKVYKCPAGCKNGACIVNQNNTLSLSVGAIKLNYSDFSLDNLKNKINNLIRNHSDVDLIVTPEYIFFGAGFAGIDYRNDPIVVECSSNLCYVKSIGTQKSDEIVTAVETLQNIAFNKKVNIVLGTIAERVVVDGINFSVDTQLIINKNGNIIGKHRKYDIAYSSEVTCEDNPSICEQVRNLNLETAIDYNLTDKEGNDFKILPHICGEKDEQKYIDKVAGSNAYLIVASDFDQDFDYKNITMTIQNGENPFANPPQFSGNWLLKEIYLNKMINNSAISQNSYMVVANGFTQDAGIISWNLSKINDLDISDDYVYGKIDLKVGE